MRASSSASVETVSIPGPQPRPGPAGPDVDELRSVFDDLLGDSVLTGTGDGADGSVHDDQVRALDSAHELLAQALTSLDSPR